MELTRRSMLQLSARVGGGLLLAIEGCATSNRMAAHEGRSGAGAGSANAAFAPNAWLAIGSDDTIYFQCDKAEMGQGPMTALAMIVAEELDVPPHRITVEFAPADRAFINTELGLQVTGGSSSVRSMYAPLRAAGAAARETLKAAAAQKWQVPVASCSTKDGKVFAKGHSATYGELADAAATLPLAEPVLTKPEDFKYIGKDVRRLDALAKSTGKAEFGIDVKVPNALVAVVLRPARVGATVKSFDAAEALKQPGIVKAFEISNGVALVGKSYWRLRKARESVKIEWEGGNDKLNSDGMKADMARLAAGADGKKAREEGDAEAQLAGAKRPVKAVYTAPYLAHAPMEPQNCTAHVTDDLCEIWAPTQSAGLAQQVGHELTGLSYDRVVVHTTFLGGGFGRRLAQDYVREAVEVAMALEQPVKVQWSREDDIRHAIYRPSTYHELTACLSDKGKIVAWQHTVVGQSILANIGPEWLTTMTPRWIPDVAKNAARDMAGSLLHWLANDVTATEGARDLKYKVPNLLVRYHMLDEGLPVGFWRSVGHSYTGFVVESFVDELAHAAGADPVAFRLQHLVPDSPEYNVLKAVAEKAGWHTPPPAGTVRGVAVHSCFGSHAAQVAEIAKQDDGSWKVARVVVGIDCGTVINPDQVRAQLESAVIFGLSAALYGSITLAKGEVEQSNFDDYPVLRADACPVIETVLIASDGRPQGAGEPGLPPTAPAVANALFKATGVRQRSLPLSLAKV